MCSRKHKRIMAEKIKLSTQDCIDQLFLYADSCAALDNPERSVGFYRAARFLEDFHEDIVNQSTKENNNSRTGMSKIEDELERLEDFDHSEWTGKKVYRPEDVIMARVQGILYAKRVLIED